ncbi:hypothetical protein EV421DRAFT_1980663 [Armillaria borealis]|uniref:Serine-threonine/tyrosine-protein kinase catalytic domain-containing protein n=1 Tax=Armillaria borealis TaxID=47425 RepID=A0AA39MK40_9AGAR|nr:hypothetical protein EV421DRAFT_1980663 [Armillaria borealis]
MSTPETTSDDFDLPILRVLSQAVLLDGFDSEKLQNPHKISKYLKCSTNILRRVLGGFAEIWRAQLASSNGKVTVAVNYLRLYVTQAAKCLYQEIRIWQSLKHPHVLPLLGICYKHQKEKLPLGLLQAVTEEKIASFPRLLLGIAERDPDSLINASTLDARVLTYDNI